MFPLGKVCSTVGTSSLPQGETADEPKGEQDDGQEDAQEGEGVLQNPDSAEREGAGLGLCLVSHRTQSPFPPHPHGDNACKGRLAPAVGTVRMCQVQRGRQTTISHYAENVRTGQ